MFEGSGQFDVQSQILKQPLPRPIAAETGKTSGIKNCGFEQETRLSVRVGLSRK